MRRERPPTRPRPRCAPLTPGPALSTKGETKGEAVPQVPCGACDGKGHISWSRARLRSSPDRCRPTTESATARRATGQGGLNNRQSRTLRGAAREVCGMRRAWRHRVGHSLRAGLRSTRNGDREPRVPTLPATWVLLPSVPPMPPGWRVRRGVVPREEPWSGEPLQGSFSVTSWPGAALGSGYPGQFISSAPGRDVAHREPTSIAA